MTTLITGSLDTLPAAPDPATDAPSTFSTKAAAMVLAIKTMVTQLITIIGEINTVTTEVNSNTTIAAAAALSAAAAASSASTSANATQWASGTYATGVCAWSPITFHTYRRTSTSPGASAVDPSAAPTLWVDLNSGVGVWSRKTSNYTAASGDRIKSSTVGGGWSLTFPPAPSDNDTIEVQDVDGTFDTSNLTILTNGLKVMGFTTSFVLNRKYEHLIFVYDSTLGDWRV